MEKNSNSQRYSSSWWPCCIVANYSSLWSVSSLQSLNARSNVSFDLQSKWSQLSVYKGHLNHLNPYHATYFHNLGLVTTNIISVEYCRRTDIDFYKHQPQDISVSENVEQQFSFLNSSKANQVVFEGSTFLFYFSVFNANRLS